MLYNLARENVRKFLRDTGIFFLIYVPFNLLSHVMWSSFVAKKHFLEQLLNWWRKERLVA